MCTNKQKLFKTDNADSILAIRFSEVLQQNDIPGYAIDKRLHNNSFKNKKKSGSHKFLKFLAFFNV